MSDQNIRLECLKPADKWVRPTGKEVREVLRLAGFTGGVAAAELGLGPNGDRTIRRWVSEETDIPYAAWAILCELAGLGIIWR